MPHRHKKPGPIRKAAETILGGAAGIGAVTAVATVLHSGTHTTPQSQGTVPNGRSAPGSGAGDQGGDPAPATPTTTTTPAPDISTAPAAQTSAIGPDTRIVAMPATFSPSAKSSSPASVPTFTQPPATRPTMAPAPSATQPAAPTITPTPRIRTGPGTDPSTTSAPPPPVHTTTTVPPTTTPPAPVHTTTPAPAGGHGGTGSGDPVSGLLGGVLGTLGSVVNGLLGGPKG